MDLLKQDLKAIFLYLFCLTKLITCPVQVPRGVSPERLSKYTIHKNFTCLDGSLSVPFSYVNDDYCDCQDGTDEPGTSACRNGIFNCRNKGHIPKNVPSSFVNDGICDCCDGSDEYDDSRCLDHCERLSEEARLEEKITRELNRKGSVLREKMVASGKIILEEKYKRKANLEKEKEEIERAIRELEKLRNNSRQHRSTDFKETKAEEITTVAANNYMDLKKFMKYGRFQPDNEVIENGEVLDDNSSTTENEDINKYKLKNDFSSSEDSPDTTMQTVEEKPEFMSEGRAHYLSAFRHKQIINQELLQVKTFLSVDYGLEQEFVTLNGHCFSFIDKHYAYDLCPFVNVTQSSTTGTNEIILGSWAGWDKENYEVMVYKKGQSCGGGINRSTKVMLKCGLINEIESVKEPNKCEYSMVFRTPAVCKVENIVQHIHSEL